MNSIARFIALSMLVALAISATTGTFGTTVAYSATGATGVLYTNGYVVTLTAAGWAYGDVLTLSSTTPSVTWTTPTALGTGIVGIGLATVGGSTCTTAPSATSSFNSASLVGKGASTTCPVDFATLYTAAPTATTSTSTTAVVTYSATNNVVLNQAIRWTISTGATGCIGLAILDGSNTAPTAAPQGTCSATNALTPATVAFNYAFYVEAAASATVCFQTDAQHTASASCGTVVTTSSSGILSAAISSFVAMIALIFFN